MTRRNEQVWLLGVTALGAALRLSAIGAQSMWFDELISVAIVRLELLDALVLAASVDPPLYYLLLHFWVRLGSDDVMIRFLSAAVGIATIPAIYVLGRRLTNASVGLVAALIFALAPLQLFYAQEARMYSLFVLLSTLSVWAYSRAQVSSRWRDWILWTCLMALVFYAHIFAGLLVLALDVDALWRWRSDKADLRPVVTSNLAIGLTLVPWMLLLIPKMEYLVGILWLQRPTIFHPLLSLYYFVFGYTLAFPLSAVGLFVLLFALMLVLLSVWRDTRQGSKPESANLRLMLLAAFLPLVVIFVISQWRSMYLDRWLLQSAPALYLLFAWGLVCGDRRLALRLCAVPGLALMILATVNYYSEPVYAKSPLREAVGYIVTQRVPGELVIHTSGSSFLAGRHYDPAGKHILLQHPADQWLGPTLLESLRVPYDNDAGRMIMDKKTFWLVVALDHIPDEQRAAKALFDQLARVTDETEIGGIGIFHYARAAH
jgi:4-amino-4-deoxy-L-arabinose transferase-like glycosyltransferase